MGEDLKRDGNGTLQYAEGSSPPTQAGVGTKNDKEQAVASRVALAAFVALVVAGFALYLRWLITQPDLSAAVVTADTWLTTFRTGNGAAVLLVLGPLAALLALVAGLLIHFGMPQVWQSARRSFQVGGLLGACLAAAWFIGTTRLSGLKDADWVFFVPVLPPALLAFQAMVMWRQRPRSVGDFRIGVSAELADALKISGDEERFAAVHRQLARVFGGVTTGPTPSGTRSTTSSGTPPATSKGEHTPTSFAVQFALPCLLLLIVGFGATALAMSVNPLGIVVDGVVARGLRWGVAGAYTYVLFTFGSRCFRSDLTVGVAIWAIITLVTGPALATVVALVGNLEAPAQGGDWQGAVVLFFAGVAPRRVMNIIETVALQFLKAPVETSTAKLIPLTTLRGISPELALRLREENIEDVTTLAYADPIRLVQSMPYDLRQVVEWIDQAQLAVALPQQFESLLDRGVTGAIDLGWRWLQACTETGTTPLAIAHGKEVPKSFDVLVRDPNDKALVYETARQMFYEEQVRLLWVMYNSFSTAAGAPSSFSEPSSLLSEEPATRNAEPLPSPQTAKVTN